MDNVLKLRNRRIGDGMPCYIIAEMSANHGGDINRAKEIIHTAKAAGADCIKIQTYTADTMTIDCNNEYFRIKEGTWKGESFYELYKKAHTPWEWHEELKDEAQKAGIDFLSTPFDRTAVDFLEELGMEFYKIASFEIVDIPLIDYVASKKKPIILSTGMATLGEIETAVNTIRKYGENGLCLLRCSSAYPAIPDDMNLKTIKHLAETFNCVSGLSDHSMGFVGALVAVCMGASVIEKHFCLSRSIETPDSLFSMEPNEFKQMTEYIRAAERAIGKVNYGISQKEHENKCFRRSVFVVKDMEKGEIFTHENIKVIRPAGGIEPKYYNEILGKRAAIGIKRGSPIDWGMVDADEDINSNY